MKMVNLYFKLLILDEYLAPVYSHCYWKVFVGCTHMEEIIIGYFVTSLWILGHNEFELNQMAIHFKNNTQ